MQFQNKRDLVEDSAHTQLRPKSREETFRGTTAPDPLTAIQWLICAVACLGFAFDLYESLMLPLIVRPALTALGNLRPGTPGFNLWVGLLFYVPNIAGGLFGLLGGYLTDLFGRRRVLFWSIALYKPVRVCSKLFHLPGPIVDTAVFNDDWGLRGICGRNYLACGALSEPQTPRGRARLHASVSHCGWPDGYRSLLLGSDLR